MDVAKLVRFPNSPEGHGFNPHHSMWHLVYDTNFPRYSPPLSVRIAFNFLSVSLSTLAWNSLKTDRTWFFIFMWRPTTFVCGHLQRSRSTVIWHVTSCPLGIHRYAQVPTVPSISPVVSSGRRTYFACWSSNRCTSQVARSSPP